MTSKVKSTLNRWPAGLVGCWSVFRTLQATRPSDDAIPAARCRARRGATGRSTRTQNSPLPRKHSALCIVTGLLIGGDWTVSQAQRYAETACAHAWERQQ